MNNIERLTVAAIVVILVIACVDVVVTWTACKESGGTAVRGVFGLECMK